MKLLNKLTILKWLLKLKMNRYKNEKEMYLLANYIFNGDVCIDIGANYGAYTYELSKIIGITGEVYSFEPGKFAFNVLNKTVKKLKNVYHCNIALSNKGVIEISLFHLIKTNIYDLLLLIFLMKRIKRV